MKLIFISFLSFLFLGCDFLDNNRPSFFLSSPEFELGTKETSFRTAGVNFELTNTGTEDINRVIISFIVYDEETKKSPWIGSNIIIAEFSERITSGETKQFEISLDNKFMKIPENSILIDFFYVKEIQYSNGQVWKDHFGVYSL